MSNTFKFKVLLVGDAASGKTTAVNRQLTGSNGQKTYFPTIGTQVYPMSITIGDKNIVLDVWDLAGQQQFACLGEGYYIGADAIVVVSNQPNYWIGCVEQVVGHHLPRIVCRPHQVPVNVFERMAICLGSTIPIQRSLLE